MDDACRVKADGWIAGRYRKAGEPIRLGATEAHFLRLAGLVERAPDGPAPVARPARKARAKD